MSFSRDSKTSLWCSSEARKTAVGVGMKDAWEQQRSVVYLEEMSQVVGNVRSLVWCSLGILKLLFRRLWRTPEYGIMSMHPTVYWVNSPKGLHWCWWGSTNPSTILAVRYPIYLVLFIIWLNIVDCGDYVIVTNSIKVKVSGKKEQQLLFRKHSMFPGGLKETPYKDMKRRHPEEVRFISYSPR